MVYISYDSGIINGPKAYQNDLHKICSVELDI